MTTLARSASRDTTPRPAMPVMAPAATGLLAIALAVYQVATPGNPTADYDSALDWLREGLFTTYLVAAITAVIVAARAGLAPRAAAVLVGVGYGAISVGVVVGMVLRDDPEWFMLLGGPGNLLAAAGFVTWAVWGRRRQVLPLFAALLCGVGGVVAVLFSELGTSVLIGAFFCWLAFRDR
jgi:hypothetical protein